MNSGKDFFLFCSGVNRSILKRTPTEVNKFVGIGATIFFTGIFAAMAAGYAMYTVFDSYYLIVPVALLWGLMIFNLDRFIVSTMKKKGSFFKDFGAATPRLILAVLIAIVIVKPIELKIFESEIETELVQMQQENYKKQDDLVRSRYNLTIDTLKSEILALKSEIDIKATERDRLVNEAIMEADAISNERRHVVTRKSGHDWICSTNRGIGKSHTKKSSNIYRQHFYNVTIYCSGDSSCRHQTNARKKSI